MLIIENQCVAAAYAVEALRVFDHLNFRSRMKNAKKDADPLVLLKPVAFAPGQKEAWFAKYYQPDTQRERDRLTFAQP